MGAYMRNDSDGDPRRRRARVRAVSAAQGAAPADRGHAVGRRAADARDGPRADVEAEAAAARRAVDGPRAADGAEGVRDRACAVSREGVTILLIEQNAKLALEVSHRGYVMESGEITLSGDGEDAAARSRGARRLSRRSRLSLRSSRADGVAACDEPSAVRIQIAPRHAASASARRALAATRSRGTRMRCGCSSARPRRGSALALLTIATRAPAEGRSRRRRAAQRARHAAGRLRAALRERRPPIAARRRRCATRSPRSGEPPRRIAAIVASSARRLRRRGVRRVVDRRRQPPRRRCGIGASSPSAAVAGIYALGILASLPVTFVAVARAVRASVARRARSRRAANAFAQNTLPLLVYGAASLVLLGFGLRDDRPRSRARAAAVGGVVLRRVEGHLRRCATRRAEATSRRYAVGRQRERAERGVGAGVGDARRPSTRAAGGPRRHQATIALDGRRVALHERLDACRRGGCAPSRRRRARAAASTIASR